jgi:hypothetical protein
VQKPYGQGLKCLYGAVGAGQAYFQLQAAFIRHSR